MCVSVCVCNEKNIREIQLRRWTTSSSLCECVCVEWRCVRGGACVARATHALPKAVPGRPARPPAPHLSIVHAYSPTRTQLHPYTLPFLSPPHNLALVTLHPLLQTPLCRSGPPAQPRPSRRRHPMAEAAAAGADAADAAPSPPLPRRPLGNTGMEVSVIGFGASPLGSVFEVKEKRERKRERERGERRGACTRDLAPLSITRLPPSTLLLLRPSTRPRAWPP